MADIVEEITPNIVPIADLLQKSVDLNIPLTAESNLRTEPVVAEENFDLMEKISKAAKHSLLPADAEFLKVKSYLTSNVGLPVNMYDHLTAVIMNAMETKNSNSVAVKRSRFVIQSDAPTTVKVKENESAVGRLQLLQQNSVDETDIGEIPDMMELSALWEWAGVSFGKEDTFLLFLSIKKLVQTKQLRSVRLWGKILGQEANYIIAEGEIKQGVEDVEDTTATLADLEQEIEAEKLADEAIVSTGPKAPKRKQFQPLAKELRQGTNQYVYYVCSKVGGEWTRLPDVVPERLQEARKIQKYFTGKLSAKIESYPQFNGNEAQYLRCQIARISAATVVSPKGYYIIDEEAEEPEEGSGVQPIVINPEFEGLPNDQLANIANWVHHVPYILPQGKSVYEAPKVVKNGEKGEEDGEEDEAKEEEEEEAQEAEVGPERLSLVSSDQEHGTIPAWSARMCSKLSPIKFAPVVLRSNRWPGAYALAYNDKFANLYIGDGQKDFGNPSQNFVPLPLPAVQKEYTVDESNAEKMGSLVEQVDPTVDDERKFEDSKKPQATEKVEDEAGDAEEDEGDEQKEEE